MKKAPIYLLILLFGLFISSCQNNEAPPNTDEDTDDTPELNTAGLELPEGFSASIVADDLGKARHIAVTPGGDIYVKLEKLLDGKGIVLLSDKDGDGKMEQEMGFGDYIGTGIRLTNKYLYASSNEEVFRYQLDDNHRVTNPNDPETIATGLIDKGTHASKSLTLDNDGNIYVNIGAPSNACQEQDRTKGSPGMDPCPILDSAGGIWRFNANALNQTYGDGIRYATGLRNVVGLDWNDQANALFVMQHGRDQLHFLYPDIYTVAQSAELPAEAMYRLEQGDDAGWPYSYYDHRKEKNILSPEYGGDGEQEGGENAIDPVVAFPGHMAPNGLLFYTGKMFPEKYHNGAFVAFHGSWNRPQGQQEGYYVAFVPFKDGQPSDDWEVFADGFAGTEVVASPRDAERRPCGLAQGPDGALYVSDDVKGTIYRIAY